MQLRQRDGSTGLPELEGYVPNVKGRDHMIELMAQVLTGECYAKDHIMSDKDTKCLMVQTIEPMEYLKVEEGNKARFQLRHAVCRFPINDAVRIRQDQFLGAIRASLLDVVDAANRQHPGEWRVVAVDISDHYRVRWGRAGTGLKRSDVEKPNDENKQLTRQTEMKDPILQFHIALAEVSRSRPMDYPVQVMGQKVSKYTTYVETKGDLQFLPYKAREQRNEAIKTIANCWQVNPDEAVPKLSGDAAKKARELLASGALTLDQVAGAFGVPPVALSEIVDSLTAPEALPDEAKK